MSQVRAGCSEPQDLNERKKLLKAHVTPVSAQWRTPVGAHAWLPIVGPSLPGIGSRNATLHVNPVAELLSLLRRTARPLGFLCHHRKGFMIQLPTGSWIAAPSSMC